MTNTRSAATARAVWGLLLSVFSVLSVVRLLHAAPDEVLQQSRAKVLLVHARVGGAERAGTGFIVGPGLVLTSEHVVRGARRITLWINEAPYAASVTRADPARDLALLSVEEAALAIKPLPVSDAATTRPGEPVLILGCHPRLLRGRVPRVRQSVISGHFQRLGQFSGALASPEGAIELLASVERGDSGSPVIRVRDGAVIGIVRARNPAGADGRSRTAWAVPMEAARPLLR
jgi:S1-C subfamily serine protease